MNLNRRQFLYNTGMTAAGIAALYNSAASAAAASETNSVADLSTWTGVKEQFAVSSDYIHLASFFLASHPRPVRDAIENFRSKLDANPLGQVEAGPSNKPLAVESAVAEYVGGKPEEIALTIVRRWDLPSSTTDYH
jgi:isopenicillin-N epimerase